MANNPSGHVSELGYQGPTQLAVLAVKTLIFGDQSMFFDIFTHLNGFVLDFQIHTNVGMGQNLGYNVGG